MMAIFRCSTCGKNDFTPLYYNFNELTFTESGESAQKPFCSKVVKFIRETMALLSCSFCIFFNWKKTQQQRRKPPRYFWKWNEIYKNKKKLTTTTEEKKKRKNNIHTTSTTHKRRMASPAKITQHLIMRMRHFSFKFQRWFLQRRFFLFVAVVLLSDSKIALTIPNHCKTVFLFFHF